jgi:hypothetical protein
MAYSSTIPAQTAEVLRQLQEKYPNIHWTIGEQVNMANGFYLQMNDGEIMRHATFIKGANILEIADKLVNADNEVQK